MAPIVGRGFGPEDDRVGGRNDVVLLGEGLWRARFAADPAIVGTAVTLDERPRTVIGVVPDGAWIDHDVQFFIPAVLDPADRGQRLGHWAEVLGRMKPGVAVAEADAELKAIKRRLDDAYPAFKRAWSVQVQGLQDELARDGPSAADRADGGRHPGAADRVREHRQPPAGARLDARA